MNETGVNLAQAGYEGYGQYTGWKTFDDREMPAWHNLPDRTRRSWAVAAQRIYFAIRNHGPLNSEHTDCQVCTLIAIG